MILWIIGKSAKIIYVLRYYVIIDLDNSLILGYKPLPRFMMTLLT